MQHFEGKTAIVTGAASGIGLGLARAFARQGMNVALCDIRGDRLDAALAEVEGLGARAIAVVTDVSERTAVENAARQAIEAFGALHVACNNAGITIHGKSVAELTQDEWDWLIGVNLYGVIYGIGVFLPLIRSHGGEGHIVNTSSIAGFQVQGERRSGGYAATKYAVVALTESLANDLAGTPVGTSVLAPAAVDTQIYMSEANRPDRFGGPSAGRLSRLQEELQTTGISPDAVGERVLRAIRDRELYIFTHMQSRDWLDARNAKIRAAYDDCQHWLDETSASASPRLRTG